MTFTFDDGYVEKTRIESKETKGQDGFMEKVFDAVATVLGTFDGKGLGCQLAYDGDFDREVALFMRAMDEIDKDPAKLKELKKKMKEAMGKKYEIHN